MSRCARSAAAVTVIATTLATVATASAGTPPKSLTHKFPLGTQALCCQSHTATTSPNPSTAAPTHSGTAPAGPPATTENHRAAAPVATARSGHSGHHGTPDWILFALAAVVLVLVLGLVGWRVIRRSPRTRPRPRRTVPHALLLLLLPVYHRDHGRDAWILRVVGDRYGPVLCANGYRPALRYEYGQETNGDSATDLPTDPPSQTPDPFEPRPARTTNRTRPRRDGRASATHHGREPPPLVIRRRPDR
jgi:hypothetical protein